MRTTPVTGPQWPDLDDVHNARAGVDYAAAATRFDAAVTAAQQTELAYIAGVGHAIQQQAEREAEAG